MDLVQMLANAVNNVTAVGIQLIIAMGAVGGLIMLVLHFGNIASRARRGQVQDGPGKIMLIILICGCVIALHQVMNATSRQMALGDVTFGAIAYVSEGKYGPAAVAINAGLTLLQWIGVIYAYQGLLRLRRSTKDGHTGLSAGDDVASGAKRIIIGTLLAVNPRVLDALQNTINFHW
ncbi:TPA: conjugal transfer protein TraQ [Yersinia enterocolitica]|uniref:TraQ n=1 Tax=Yersinia intermedia TaxID=631 RepID=A0A0T9MTB9_YERIN|nr:MULTISPECIES: conjugal transfer protein TraQ [Yersinia]EKN5031176.1 TraQ [Yersinia enterocolitica]EKN3347701.1 conjugal transfer protein TraQ [Yersinia ruckeri]EKN6368077.1 TraQ [Yersinia enterocolitica]MCB5310581.1 conjugal transfer protein TraQ [Yersinia massiliensis]MCB5319914.1 conjugal transfer protein TraQ [Yersinia massiliensis]